MRRLFEKSIVRVYIESRVAWKVDKFNFEALTGQLASFWGQEMKIYTSICNNLVLTQFWPKEVSWRFEITTDELTSRSTFRDKHITTLIFQRRRGVNWKGVRWWRWWWRDCHWRDSATTPTPAGGGPLKLKDKVKTRLNKSNAYHGVKHGRTTAGNQTSKGTVHITLSYSTCILEWKQSF